MAGAAAHPEDEEPTASIARIRKQHGDPLDHRGVDALQNLGRLADELLGEAAHNLYPADSASDLNIFTVSG